MLWNVDAGERKPLWPWITAAIAAAMVGLLAILLSSVQVGRCVDYTAESGLQSFCESGPVLHSPVGIVITVGCATVAVVAVIRIVLLSLRRAGVR